LAKKYFRREELLGKDIISDAAARVGKVKDIGYDAEGRIVLIYDKAGDGGEDAIPSSQIIAFGDVILVKSVAHEEKSSQATVQQMKVCPNCGKENAPDMLFCTGCGSRLVG